LNVFPIILCVTLDEVHPVMPEKKRNSVEKTHSEFGTRTANGNTPVNRSIAGSDQHNYRVSQRLIHFVILVWYIVIRFWCIPGKCPSPMNPTQFSSSEGFYSTIPTLLQP